MFNRLTGALEATIPYPPAQLQPFGLPSFYPNGNTLMQIVPGCCGLGISIIKIPEFVESEFISEPFTDAIVTVPGGFWTGMETGEVGFFDSQNHLAQKLNLRTMTGHTGIEDIEIRSIWADGFDDLVFAASDWGERRFSKSYLAGVLRVAAKVALGLGDSTYTLQRNQTGASNRSRKA